MTDAEPGHASGIPPEIERKLRLCPSLPTLSSVAVRIIEATRDPDIQLSDLADLLANDPALAAKTLRMANSALYQRGRHARSLQQAINILGLHATVSVALSFSLGTTLENRKDGRIDLRRFWRRSLLCALAARLLGDFQNRHGREELFLAGLLQDIGMLALDVALPDRYAVVEIEAQAHDGLSEREYRALGVDHCEAGAWLMEQWGLPHYLAASARASHADDAADGEDNLGHFVACIAVSRHIADIYLDDDTRQATTRARQAAEHCLDLSSRDLGEVLDRMAETRSDIETLFEMTLLSDTEAAGVTEQARELLTTRDLELMRSTNERRVREQEYEAQADHLDQMARRDALTGVYNRWHFDQTLEQAMNRALQNGEALCVAYLDIDRFKRVNDDYGHPIGDMILSNVAADIQAGLRDGDVFARYGGEEFVLMLPRVDDATAFRIVDRIRRAVAELEHPLESGARLRVTVSAGVAAFSRTGDNFATTPDEMLRAADNSLYRAKQSGRNRVVCAD